MFIIVVLYFVLIIWIGEVTSKQSFQIDVSEKYNISFENTQVKYIKLYLS